MLYNPNTPTDEVGGLNTLHLGPLDYNVATTVDNLLAAVRLLEEFGMRNAP